MNNSEKIRQIALLTTAVIFCVCAAFADLSEDFVPLYDDPAIEYATRPTNDRIATLNAEIEAGRARLKFDGEQGYLRSVLEALNIPVESQMAVFSKTSVQARLINPQNPRTLFFNDSVVIGWVRGGFIEVAAESPQQGIIFYSLQQTPENTPQFTRKNECLQCHDSNDALGVPGMLVRSEFTGPNAMTLRNLGSYNSDHRSPLEQRWGGWYVTGRSGSIRHMGNAIVTDPSNPESMVTPETLNVDSLKGKFDTDAYLSPYSDIVALMVFEHQMRMMNLLTRLGWQTRFALSQRGTSKPAPNGVPNQNSLDFNQRDLRDTTNELVDYMLFADEAPLANRIQGTSGFAEKFSRQGPHDSKGRSLRQLDLERRLMRYPCSYMIYSEAFDNLPSEARETVYSRMWQILSGKAKRAKYARLSLVDRQAIVEILLETKKDLPEYFQPIAN
jgi:hypothetical protein